nr:probable ribosomal protein S11, mitochondrial [Tanacetum cinerariifolium]
MAFRRITGKITTTQKHHLFSGTSGLYAGSTRVLHNAMPKFLGSLGMQFGSAQAHFIHSAGPNEFERGMNNRPTETERKPGIFEGLGRRLDNTNRTQPPVNTGPNPGFFEGLSRRLSDIDRTRAPNETGGDSRPFGRGFGSSEVTDSKGNKKMGASAGSLAEMSGGPKVSKYSAEATAEHVGRVAKSMGLK